MALSLFATGTVAAQPRSDVLAVPETAAAPTAMPISMPAKGSSMADVERKFGEPRAKQPPAGGDSPKHPPITRWDYEGFRVFFEHDKVIDTVIPGRPPRIHNRDELTPIADGTARPLHETAPPPADDEGMIPEAPADAPTLGEPPVATPDNPNPDSPPPPQ